MAVRFTKKLRIVFKIAHHYQLLDQHGQLAGELIYSDLALTSATIRASETTIDIRYEKPGKWISTRVFCQVPKKQCQSTLRPGGTMLLYYSFLRRNYTVRKSGKYNGRFDLINRKQEELLTFHPLINWVFKGHEYRIQMNDEYRDECSSLLILHAVHCVNCLLGIINGTAVPALVDI